MAAAAFPLLTTVRVTCLLAKQQEVQSWEGGVGLGGRPDCEVGREGPSRPRVRPPLPAPAFAAVRPAAAVTRPTFVYKFLGDGLRSFLFHKSYFLDVRQTCDKRCVFDGYNSMNLGVRMVPSLRPRRAVSAAQHKIVNLLKT